MYFAIHTLLADLRVKEIIQSAVPALTKPYRLIYNVIAVGGLAALIGLSTREMEYLYHPGLISVIPGLVILIFGIWIVYEAVRYFDLPEFFGIKPFKTQTIAATDEGLITSGLYRYVRHPLYSGTLMLTVGWFMVFPTVALAIFLICMALYLPVGIFFEEKKLVKEFGRDYIEYQRKVFRLIPGIY
jgi:methanethiol S-methyltransferase